MRETIAYKKNFITGEEETSIKMKSDDTSIRGIATIQLFEGDKLIEEHKVENAITDMAKKIAFEEYFFRRIQGDNEGRITAVSPFLYLGLSSDDVEEDTSLFKNLSHIGYAHKSTPYSGDSETQGTVNLAETNLYKIDTNGNRVLHYVFDFPTHCCNGVINNLFWTNRLNNYLFSSGMNFVKSGGNVLNYTSHISSISPSYCVFLRDVSGDILIFIGTTSTSLGNVSVIGKYDTLFVVDGVTFELKYMRKFSELDTANNYIGVGAGVGTLIIANSYTDFKEYNYLEHTIKNLEVILPTKITSGGLKTAKIYMHRDNKTASVIINGHHVFLGNRVGDTITFENEQVVAHVTSLSDGVTMMYQQVTVVGDDLVYTRGSNVVNKVNLKTREKESKTLSGLGYYYCLLLDYDFGESLVFDVQTTSNNFPNYSIKIETLRNGQIMGAINKLPTPIHKTSVNTMKVQYDFIVEDVKSFFATKTFRAD